MIENVFSYNDVIVTSRSTDHFDFSSIAVFGTRYIHGISLNLIGIALSELTSAQLLGRNKERKKKKESVQIQKVIREDTRIT